MGVDSSAGDGASAQRVCVAVAGGPGALGDGLTTAARRPCQGVHAVAVGCLQGRLVSAPGKVGTGRPASGSADTSTHWSLGAASVSWRGLKGSVVEIKGKSFWNEDE